MSLIQATCNTKHGLQFLSAPWRFGWDEFRVGTMRGTWRADTHTKKYLILNMLNEHPGNGHFDDLMQWFEFSAKRDGYSLVIMEVWNDRLAKHLVEKRGFSTMGNSGHYEKKFDKDKSNL